MALVAPAGPVDGTTIERAIRRCRQLGLEPLPGAAVRQRAGYLAGSDRDRAGDLTHAILGDVAGIWALRGGYGTLRTLEHVDLTPLRERPKPFIGFSDNTVVHLALYREGLVSFHGPHAGYEHFPALTESVFRAVLMDSGAPGRLPVPDGAHPGTVHGGTAEGPLVGGNLSLLAATCGTPYQPDARGAILFLEDVGEPLYRIDRMLTQLRLAGVLEGVAAIAIGDMSRSGGDPAGEDVGGPAFPEMLRDLLGRLGVPVAFGLPFGHGRENWTLPLGVTARLDAGSGTLELLQAATMPGRDR